MQIHLHLDDSADYVYVDFEEGGYALFSSITKEMMEYSLQGALPYSTSTEKEYYAGPANYLQKNDSGFLNMKTDEQLNLAPAEAIAFSQQARNHTLSRTEYRTNVALEEGDTLNEIKNLFGSNASIKSGLVARSAPNLDTNNLIQAPMGVGATLIPNYNYFIVNPTHGENRKNETYANGKSGTCASVAAQILLGYHNYYSDRRIVPDRFLDGFDDTTNTVATPAFNPNYCTDPMVMESWLIGTRSEPTGANSFYVEMINRIMVNSNYGASLQETTQGIASYLNSRLLPSGYLIDYEEFSTPSQSASSNLNADIRAEINKGRPIIISTGSGNFGATEHAMVGYGYQTFTYNNGAGTYEGYIVHYGWKDENCVWINSAWCDGYVSLKINHTHNYSEEGPIPRTNRTEYKCTTCGHRTDAVIDVTENSSYTEWVASIPQNDFNYNHKEYYVTFETAGNMLFQTFGSEDAQLYLFDLEYNQLAFDDDSGYRVNAMFGYTVQANTPYILRLDFYDTTYYGDVKLSITPASYECQSYDEIDTMPASGDAWSFDLYYDTTYVLTFRPSTSGTYRIKTTPFDDIDVVVYVADATATTACHCDDNGSTSQVSNFTMNLVAGTSYFIVVSASDITTEEGFVDFSIRKVS